MPKRTEKMSEPIAIRFRQSFLDRVDEWRSKQRPIPSRGEVIRRLAEEKLAEVEAKPDKPKKGGKP
jgi:hypothetical protein